MKCHKLKYCAAYLSKPALVTLAAVRPLLACMYSIQPLTARRVLSDVSRFVSFSVPSGSIVIVDMLNEG